MSDFYSWARRNFVSPNQQLQFDAVQCILGTHNYNTFIPITETSLAVKNLPGLLSGQPMNISNLNSSKVPSAQSVVM
jgi:hypothetical protein